MVSALMQPLYSFRTMLMLLPFSASSTRKQVPFKPIYAHQINLSTWNGNPHTGNGGPADENAAYSMHSPISHSVINISKRTPVSDDNYAARLTVIPNNARTLSSNIEGYRNPNPSLSMTALQSLVSKTWRLWYLYIPIILKQVRAIGNLSQLPPRHVILRTKLAAPMAGIRSLDVMKLRSFRWPLKSAFANVSQNQVTTGSSLACVPLPQPS